MTMIILTPADGVSSDARRAALQAKLAQGRYRIPDALVAKAIVDRLVPVSR